MAELEAALAHGASRDRHLCLRPAEWENDAYGAAYKWCFEDPDRRLWVSNVEYMSQVKYCPVCGFASRGQMLLVEPYAPGAGIMIELKPLEDDGA